MFWRRRPCRCEKFHKDHEAILRSLERLRAEREEDLAEVVTLRRKIASEIRSLGTKARRAEKATAELRAAEGDAEAPDVHVDQIAMFPATGGNDRASRKAALLARFRGR